VPRYNPSEIEPRWQRFWDQNSTFKTPETVGEKKLYALDMFPYPSGEGLHVGHPEGYTATDIVARHARMNGVTVLHPMGFDAFGLPAEDYAIKTNTPPRVSTEKNIRTFTRQLKRLGFSYDWDRQISTTDVAPSANCPSRMMSPPQEKLQSLTTVTISDWLTKPKP